MSWKSVALHALISITVPCDTAIVGPVARPSSPQANRTRMAPEILVSIERGGGTFRSQIEAVLRDMSRSGRLGPNPVLPSSRVLAHDLGVSRGVVVAAYEQLTAEGFLISQPRGRTIVAP